MEELFITIMTPLSIFFMAFVVMVMVYEYFRILFIEISKWTKKDQ